MKVDLEKHELVCIVKSIDLLEASVIRGLRKFESEAMKSAMTTYVGELSSLKAKLSKVVV